MKQTSEHPHIPILKQELAEGKIGRREFLRFSTLLGLSATAAYAFAGQTMLSPARAAAKGGNLRISMRVMEIATPHTLSWGEGADAVRQVCDYLTKTGTDNVTRPMLLEGWEASDDLKTWHLRLRKDVKWHSGRGFVADDVIWNLQHVLDPATGSSVIGLMKGYMLDEYDTGKKDDDGKPVMSTRLWDANAITRVDDHTVRLSLKEPQVAVPEHLFHYPLLMLDPAEGGAFKVGSNGTGAFELTEHIVGEKAVFTARSDYWGPGPHLDTLSFLDLGDDPSAAVAAMASRQIDGVRDGDVTQLDVYNKIPDITIHQSTTAQTGVARVQVDREEFKDPRVRKAMRLAIDTRKVLELAHRNLGAAGEHHHVSPVHPEYYELAFAERDLEGAKKLLAEAGYADGFNTEISCKKDPAWEIAAVQVMAEQWKEAGINVDINVLPSAKFWEVWDKAPFGFTEWTHRPLGFMVLSLAYRSGVPWNESHYANPEFDKVLTTVEGTLDLDERRGLIKRLEEIMQEDGPIVQPLWRSVYAVMSNKVTGFSKHPTSYIFGNELGIES